MKKMSSMNATKADMIERPVERITHDEIVKPIGSMKTERHLDHQSLTRIRVLMELCQRVLDGKGMPDEWKTSVVVPIFKGTGDVLNCRA